METITNKEEEKPLVLIVDDEPKNLQVLGNILRKKNYKVSAATDGSQGLEMIKKILPDLVLLDIKMPGPDGFEVCTQLKSAPETRDIPIIFLTAKTATEDILKGFAVGAVDYITKPFKTAELSARVHTHVELKKTRDREKKLIADLQRALARVKQLSGLLPICTNCKKIRNDEGYWQQVEGYIQAHSEAKFSHSLCPQCIKIIYPDMADEIPSIP